MEARLQDRRIVALAISAIVVLVKSHNHRPMRSEPRQQPLRHHTGDCLSYRRTPSASRNVSSLSCDFDYNFGDSSALCWSNKGGKSVLAGAAFGFLTIRGLRLLFAGLANASNRLI